jgi:tripartite-type tricarboxylate transporter receptor subunit TctC
VGGANAVTALAGGHVSSVARFPGEGEALIEAGKVRLLTVFDSKRCKFYPNVPTSQEEGYPMEAVGWATLMGPKGVPKHIVKFWETIIEKITRDAAFIDRAEKIKMNIEFKSAEEFKKHLQKEVQDFSAVAKELGLKPM